MVQARVGISGYGILDKIHLLDYVSFYFVAGYFWIWISIFYSIADNFGFGYKKILKSYPKSFRLDTSLENRIRLILDWIQIQNVESVSSGCGYNFSKMYPYPMDLNTSLKT